VRRGQRFAALALLALARTASVAQQERDAYSQAYQNWRQTDPNLERDAANGGSALGARADKVAAEAAKYFAARKAYLDAQRTGAEQKASVLEPLITAEFGSLPVNFAATQSTAISSSISAITADPDRMIQRLRQALEQERSALTALNTALGDSQKGMDAIKRSGAAAEQARVKVEEYYKTLAGDLQQSGQQTADAGISWANYYRTLSEVTRGAAARGPALSTVIAPVRAPGNAPATASPNGTGPQPRTASITPLPLYRYTGEWNYPSVGGQFHGTQPASVDLAVSEENGQAKGTLVVRFQVPPGGVVDSSMRFTFEGPFQNARNQSFPFVTSTGGKGTLELSPTSVFNMLQVAYKIEANPPRVGDFLVVKK
jgi:hypothetical protein